MTDDSSTLLDRWISYIDKINAQLDQDPEFSTGISTLIRFSYSDAVLGAESGAESGKEPPWQLSRKTCTKIEDFGPPSNQNKN